MDEKALKSLLKNTKKKEPIYLQTTTTKNVVKVKNPAPVMLKLKHRLRQLDEQRILLIVKNKQPEVYQQLQEKENSATKDMFQQIISISKLQSKVKNRKAIEELKKSVDLVLVDHRIVDKLPNILGPMFYKSGKDMPVPIRLYKPENPNDTVAARQQARNVVDPLFIKQQVRLAVKSSAMALTPSTCLSVQIGWAWMEYDQLLENLSQLKDEVKKRVENDGNGVKGFQIKSPESVALPL